ncbi:HTH araC/xylS-type domain-containing protein [Hyphomicrobiales bacterium]|nr:HTH araC/xylS-type domain-containing protein [Hyphomicrobiales bacterium]CAH1699286.1 HTH araC/xylS-type domain-containing protein [Hyphomicrobiales bacterium]CAI0343073.1 AraC family transcriptional regulator, positive regulator of tynA and feaB [Hyphomicrobiales bacterium]
MTPVIFTTVGLPKARQLDAWRGWFEGLFDVEIEDPQGGFAATSETWNLGSFGLSRVQAPRLRALRTPALVRRNPIDHWGIAIGGQRTFGETGRQRSIDVPAGMPFVASFGRELVSLREKDDRLQLYLPRDGFPELVAVLEGAEGRPLSGAMGKLLAEFVSLLARNASVFSDADLPGLQTAVRSMVLACIAPSPDHDDLGATPVALTRKEIVRRIIDLNLRSPALGPDFLCREAGMSRSQLYRLFESEGGVKNYIQRRRLKQCFAELSDGANARSVASIAEGLGFLDPSSFSRSFKKEFGLTPKEAMHATLSGIPMNVARGGESDSEVLRLRDLLGQIASG